MRRENHLEYTLNRIIQGRFRINVNGVDLYIYEPAPDLIFQSYDIYNEIYDEAYMSNVYNADELTELLIENDIWSPYFDKKLKEAEQELEDRKVDAYQNFFKGRELYSIKRKIEQLNKNISSLLAKKHSMDHNSCHGMADTARWDWIIQNSVFDLRGIKQEIWNVNIVMEIYKSNMISQSDIRAVARLNSWRAMWSSSKRCGSLFSRSATELTRDQLALCSYSTMYDNVYENPECPDDKIIEDDDCLDGWFIYQKRKQDEEKKKRGVSSMITNPKIQNASEVFVMAGSEEEAKAIFDLNDPMARNTIIQRNQVIQQQGRVKDTDFVDVKQDIEIRKNQMISNHIKGK